jgi:hypothetical protein
VVFIALFLALVTKYFDNDDISIEFEDIKKLRIDQIKSSLLEKKQELIQNINITTLKNIAQTGKVIFLKPIQIKEEIDFQDVIQSTKQNLNTFYKIIFSKPFNIMILWLLALIISYGFRDTFVSTFQVEFLTKII